MLKVTVCTFSHFSPSLLLRSQPNLAGTLQRATKAHLFQLVTCIFHLLGSVWNFGGNMYVHVKHRANPSKSSSQQPNKVFSNYHFGKLHVYMYIHVFHWYLSNWTKIYFNISVWKIESSSSLSRSKGLDQVVIFVNSLISFNHFWVIHVDLLQWNLIFYEFGYTLWCWNPWRINVYVLEFFIFMHLHL